MGPFLIDFYTYPSKIGYRNKHISIIICYFFRTDVPKLFVSDHRVKDSKADLYAFMTSNMQSDLTSGIAYLNALCKNVDNNSFSISEYPPDSDDFPGFFDDIGAAEVVTVVILYKLHN